MILLISVPVSGFMSAHAKCPLCVTEIYSVICHMKKGQARSGPLGKLCREKQANEMHELYETSQGVP